MRKCSPRPKRWRTSKKTVIGKVDYWSPILKEHAPKALVLPQPLSVKYLTVGSSRLDMKGGDISANTYLWDADSRTILGGIPLSQNMHVWLADSQTRQSRQAWGKTLAQMAALKPKHVIAGHYFGESTPQVIVFTQNYLTTFEKNLAASKTSAQLIAKMKRAYPKLAGESDLETSAKVLTGEMKW